MTDQCQFLCPHQLAQLQSAGEQGPRFWQRCCQAGTEAFHRGDWPAATRGYGLAYEVAQLTLCSELPGTGQPPAAQMLIGASQPLALSLGRRGQWRSAEYFLAKAHDGLLAAAANVQLPLDERIAANRALDQSLQQIKGLWALSGGSPLEAKLVAFTRRRQRALAASLYH